MASAYSTIIGWENLRSVGFADINTTFVPIGTPFANPIRILKVYNSTNQDLILSDNGLNDKDVFPATSAQILDINSNTSTQGGWLVLKANSQLYVRYPGSAPSSGSLYIVAIYGKDA